jgi:hypothetical protein
MHHKKVLGMEVTITVLRMLGLSRLSETELHIRKNGEIDVNTNNSVKVSLKPTGEVEIEASGDVKKRLRGQLR